jgi:CHAT domain-containing protein
MGPVLHDLEEVVEADTRIVLIPSGLLGLLPLHAAWTPDASRLCGREYAFDHFVFTYAPNANALRLARARFAGNPTDSLLMVENPNDDLHFSEQAAQTALALFDNTEHLAGANASVEAVSSAFGQSNVLFFFTHGFADFFEPLESGLELADHRRLTIAQIFGLETEQARLAVLSACETGVQPELRKLDEVTSLPSSMMQAGVPAVVGSLWTVVESSTAILMAIFFEEWRLRGLTARAALRKAQFILRDAPYSREARDYFKQSLPESNLSPAEAADVLFKELKVNSEDFSHPFYWAAFTYTGL